MPIYLMCYNFHVSVRLLFPNVIATGKFFNIQRLIQVNKTKSIEIEICYNHLKQLIRKEKKKRK